jgi:hypothetical protein
LICDPSCNIALLFFFQSQLIEDFRELRTAAEKQGMFKPNPVFYIAVMLHILFFDWLGWWTMYMFGTGWIPYVVAACFLTVAQVSMQLNLFSVNCVHVHLCVRTVIKASTVWCMVELHLK